MTEVLDETTEAPETPEEPETTEEPEEEPEAPETPPETPETPVESNENAMEALFGAAQKRAKTYMKAVPDVLGPAAADLQLCPLCTDLLPGFVLPPQVKPVVGDQLVAVKLAIGEGVERPLKQDRRAFVCDDCDGEGKVLTGSHVRGQDRLKCESCNGRGWVGPRATTAPEAAGASNGYVEDEAGRAVEDKPQLDPWGRMRGDPLYGVMPGFEPEL